MNIYLTFDIEIWCNGWSNLDDRFQSSFKRYVYGRSKYGEYALPKTLAILEKYGISGIFFVEPLFAARFGIEYLATIVGLIHAAGHEIQLHLHPEWADEIRPPLFLGESKKRQHLSYFTQEEQRVMINLGQDLLRQVGVNAVTAFRAGSYAANTDTYKALAQCGIFIDSSLNHCHSVSGSDFRTEHELFSPSVIHGVKSLPISVFRDGFGKPRPAQIGACSFSEMRSAIATAAQQGAAHFVIVSHNFEMLRQGSSEPDRIVESRFEALCHYLATHRTEYKVSGMQNGLHLENLPITEMPFATASATVRRYAEQALRRITG